MNNIQKIQISRSKYIETSRAVAVLRLNEYNFKKGEICMLNYYKDPDYRNNVGVIVAIGVSDGVGENSYRIISQGGAVRVRGVQTTLPDVSLLVHNELYVYGDDQDEWWYVHIDSSGTKRVIEKITGGPYIFIDLETGYRWFYKDQDCQREDDFFSTAKTQKILPSLISEGKVYVEVSSVNGWIFKTGEVKDIKLLISAKNKKGEDVSKFCKFYIDDKEIGQNSEGYYVLASQDKSRDIEVEAKYDPGFGVPVSYYGSTSIKFGYEFYYGGVKDDWNGDVTELIEKLWYRENFEVGPLGLNMQYMIFAYPKTYGYLSHIMDIHGLDYIHTYQSYIQKVGDIDYVVYKLKKPITISDFVQVYKFYDPESIKQDSGLLYAVLEAWKNKNSLSGLVLLDENGKIPENLYTQDLNKAFPEILRIDTSYLNSGLVVGGLYYNSTTKKFYIAQTDTDYVLSDPDPRKIYYYNNKYYTWTGDNFESLSIIKSEKINNIEEIYG